MRVNRRDFPVWKKLGLLGMVSVFALLGYTGVMVMKYSQYERSSVLGDSQNQQPQEREARVYEEGTQDDGSSPGGPLVVLVLSSMARGGSTLMADLLSATPGAVVVFEPLWEVEKQPCYKDEGCVHRFLLDVLSCSFKENFEEWLKGKGIFFRYFSKQARDCLGLRNNRKRKACLDGMNLRSLCAAAPMVVVKTIRTRMAWVNNMLEDTLINLKVIHLTRDPRGSLRSIQTFGWNHDPHQRCSELEDDLKAFTRIQEAFPDKVMQVQYEQLCIRPKEVVEGMFRFLLSTTTLPPTIASYLDKHILSGIYEPGTMNTIKNSSAQYQAWRFKISEDLLTKVEEEPTCQRSIKSMGHAIFGSLVAARNSSLPLIISKTAL